MLTLQLLDAMRIERVGQALRLLPTNLSFPLSELSLTPYIPVPESNGEEWDRLEQASALDALVELVLHGEYNGIEDRQRARHGLELRGSAVAVFEVTWRVFSLHLVTDNPL
jgi:hypothetical protein